MKNILLTGGSGLLGTHLTEVLLARGYTVSHLSRGPGKNPKVKTYQWDIDKGIIDELAIDGVDTIIHLAGAGIADKRWTDDRKKLLIKSRTKSIGLVYDLLKKKPHTVKNIISASGIGYYSDRGDELMFEDSAPANDFLATCCIEWENAVDDGKDLGLRVVKFRTGVVLDAGGGALPQLSLPVKFGVGAALGNGKQWMSWIHWQDVVDMYLFGIENDIKGVYNMVAPNPVTNKQLTKAVAKHLKRPLWVPNVPALALKLFLGEMSTLVLGGTKVSPIKIEDAGFKFKFTTLDGALTDIYGR
ncbi:MAG: TIGR01777 family protein [Sphingobacteriales bacterium]|nr:MAG: TIGR01777 family protein [Sphingobacteriales bacterium]